jgi:hypothetical protein
MAVCFRVVATSYSSGTTTPHPPDVRWKDRDLSSPSSLTLVDLEPVNLLSLTASSDSGTTTSH